MKFIIIVSALMVAVLARPGAEDQYAQILRYENDNIGIGDYKYAYETSNGIVQEEQGQLKNPGTDQEASVVQGRYSYVGPDGITYTVTYIADENGFRPQGAHIPRV